jgi:ribokinase
MGRVTVVGNVEANAGVIQRADVSLSPLEIPLQTALAAAQVAQAAGRKFILNPAPAVNLRGTICAFSLTPTSV